MSTLLEMRQSQLFQFMSIVSNLIVELRLANDMKEEAIKSGTSNLIAGRIAKSTVTRKFFTEFYNLVSVSADLYKTFKYSEFMDLVNLPRTAYTYDSNKTTINNSETAINALNILVPLLDRMKQPKLAKALTAELQRFKKLKQMSAPNNRKRSDEFDDDNTELRNLQGKQRAQVEQVVNQVISQLPKHVQHEARLVVSKSDNKLAALEAFITNL